MTATVRSESPLPGLPSASGVEIVGDVAYVIGDDSPYLYQLDAATLAPRGRVELFATADFATGRIPKPLKPDLECLTAVPAGLLPGVPGPALLLLGSGSLPTREVAYAVPVPPAVPGLHPAARPLALAGLYARLRPQLPAGAALNLEAAATTDTELLLLQRTVGQAGGAALVFRLPLAATLHYVLDPSAAAPAVRTLRVALPAVDGRPAGFSGATFAQGRLWVTASVEDTADAVLDGAVLGSFVGVLNLETQTARLARLTWPDGRPYTGKVEGLAVLRAERGRPAELLLVTDDDQGGSTALRAEVDGFA